MLAAFSELRALALLRRIARALEEMAVIERDRHAIEVESHVRRSRPVRLASLDVMDPDAAAKAWRRANPRYDGTDDFSPEDAG